MALAGEVQREVTVCVLFLNRFGPVLEERSDYLGEANRVVVMLFILVIAWFRKGGDVLARKVQRKVLSAGPLPNRLGILFDEVSNDIRVWEGIEVEDTVQREPPLFVPIAEPMWRIFNEESDHADVPPLEKSSGE